MPHPALGLPPSDPTAGQPDVARRLRDAGGRLPASALASATRIDPSFRDRYDALALRQMLRDFERHVEQLALAIETGEERHVVMYAEWLVPLYRRRGVRMNDVVTLIRGLEAAAVAVVPSPDATAIHRLTDAWVERLRHHRRLPGDHTGNALARFIWKGAGLGDDTVV